MQLNETYFPERGQWGKPLAGLRVLAAEHMQALPFGTQLLAVMGADVIKVESPGGEGGRAGRPIVPLPDGTTTGATFARNNLNKSSIVLDLKNPEGRATFLRLAQEADIVCENMRPGVMDRLGVGYADVAAVNPRTIYLSVSGFGNLTPSPYSAWPAYAPVAEAMSGLYELSREEGQPPRHGVAGALGDNAAALYGVIGVLAALRHRDATGLGQHVDVCMFDSMMAINEMYPQVWSLGLPTRMMAGKGTGVMTTFKASDGYFLIAVIRQNQMERLSDLLDKPEWLTDPRLAERTHWSDHIEDIFRPAIDEWAGVRTRAEVVSELAKAGIPAGPCFTMDDLVEDPHVDSHNMLVEMPTDSDRPVLMVGNPIKMSRLSEGPLRGHPTVGQDQLDVLNRVLDLSDDEIERLRTAGAFGA